MVAFSANGPEMFLQAAARSCSRMGPRASASTSFDATPFQIGAKLFEQLGAGQVHERRRGEAPDAQLHGGVCASEIP